MEKIYENFDRLRDWWTGLYFTTIQRRALGVIALILVGLSAAFVLRGHSEVIAAPVVSEIEIQAPLITIDVTGEVLRPGVYQLPAQSRVVDAIDAAGGAKPKAALSELNLARQIKDGEQIYVDPEYVAQGNFSGVTTKKRAIAPRGPINVNRATAGELDLLDGIGPVIAKRIITYRNSNGPFMAIEDLLKVSGIGAAKLAQFKEKIRI
jgi:competence protein ComEA